MIVTAKKIRLLWWSMFWRFFVYTQITYFVVEIITDFFKEFLHDPAIHDLMRQHNFASDGIQGGIEALASGIALTQALKLHLPPLFKRASGSLQTP
jgi:hypothetical protein